ncbi:MAG: HEAT repeat domain-containing protein, partial [Chthoniobacteraceae bacterium]
TGTTVYRGDAYGADFVNNTFTGDAGGQLVHRKKIHPDGVSLVGRRPDDEQGFEFAASRDTWVRVVNFANAPDGCLHICDMYREVIEHPWSIPDEIKKHLDLNSGNDRGRIYRIVPDEKSWQHRGKSELGKASTAELVQTLAHPNGWHRDTAARLLNERQDQSAVPMLEKFFGERGDALPRFHALGVLAGLGALGEATILQALNDEDANVREHAIALAPSTAQINERLFAMVADHSARVRFQLALSLGDIEAKRSAPLLAELAKNNAADPWISTAVLSAPPAHARLIFDHLKSSGFLLTPDAASLAAPLVQINAASGDAARRRDVIAFVAATPRAAYLRALGEGLRRAGTTIEKADTEKQLAATIAQAAATAAEPSATTSARTEAIELLSLTPPQQAQAALTVCLAKEQPDAIQCAAIKALAQHSSVDTTYALIDYWGGYGSLAKEAALGALVSREDRARALLTAIQSGMIPAGELPASQVQNLVHHKDLTIAVLAKRALASVIPPSRAEMVARFQPALATKGDASRGLAIYQSRCVACHRAAGMGLAVGPDLITVKTKGREALLTAILEPHKEVASQFIAYTVSTKDGQIFQGIITKDDASNLTIRMLGGQEVTVPRSNIKGSASAGQSLMPEGLEAGLDVQGMAALLTFIEELE